MPVLAGPNEGRGSDLRWTAVVALAAGLLATTAAWRVVSTHEQSEVRWATSLAARAIRQTLLTDIEWQMVGLDRLGMLWEAADPAQELWTRNAQLYIEHRPGCVAVEWLASDRERRVLVTAPGRTHPRALASVGRPEALLEAANRAGVATIGAPETLPDGSSQWAIAYPVYAKGQSRGFVVTFFDLEESLDHILGSVRDLGFSFGVTPPHQPEYVLPGTSRKHEQEWGTVVSIPVSGTTWQVRVWPNADVVNEIRSRFPEAALGVGSVLSLLTALCVYLAATATLSAARARRTNEGLQREIIARQGAEEELHRAQAELEGRAEQRAAELARANVLLQREVTEHQRAEETLRELTGRLFQLQDEERRRLGRELHDGAVQNLVALAIDVGLLRDALPEGDGGARELVNECVGLIQQSTNELRTISYLLHPPYFDELGLPASLRDLVDGFAARSGIEVALDIDPHLGRLGHEMELAIYRVTQEALSNVHRHAESRTASIALARHGESVRLEIADAGRGIPPEALAPQGAKLAGVGIAGMRERVRGFGGQLEIRSDCGGTRIQAVLPAPVRRTAKSGSVREG